MGIAIRIRLDTHTPHIHSKKNSTEIEKYVQMQTTYANWSSIHYSIIAAILIECVMTRNGYQYLLIVYHLILYTFDEIVFFALFIASIMCVFFFSFVSIFQFWAVNTMNLCRCWEYSLLLIHVRISREDGFTASPCIWVWNNLLTGRCFCWHSWPLLYAIMFSLYTGSSGIIDSGETETKYRDARKKHKIIQITVIHLDSY